MIYFTQGSLLCDHSKCASFVSASLFGITSGSVILPPESVGARQPVSKSIELILPWRRWEPEPWQPSSQISVGRELAGDMHTPHTHTNKSIFLRVCCQIEPNPFHPDRYRCSFIGCTHSIEVSPSLSLPQRYQSLCNEFRNDITQS